MTLALERGLLTPLYCTMFCWWTAIWWSVYCT